MKLFTVHVEPRLRMAVLVKEGFSWPAFLFQPAWALWHGLWATALLVALGIAGVTLLPIGHEGQAAVALGQAALLGYVANDLHRWALERRGFRFGAVIAGRDRESAEYRFIDRNPEIRP
jgi:hypothetical protein